MGTTPDRQAAGRHSAAPVRLRPERDGRADLAVKGSRGRRARSRGRADHTGIRRPAAAHVPRHGGDTRPGPGPGHRDPTGRAASGTALEDTYESDTFSPRRDDWINGTDAYLRGPAKKT